MKKKIPKWLSRAAALVGILVFLVSSLLIPVSAAEIGSSSSLIYKANNTVSQIQYVEVQPHSKYGYGYTDGPYDVIMQTPKYFTASPTATGSYTKYAPIATQVNSAGPIINDRVLLTTSGGPQSTQDGKGSMRLVTTKFYNHNQSNTINANMYPTPIMNAIVFTIDDAYILKGQRKGLDANINNPNVMKVLLPTIVLGFAGGYTEYFDIKISYTVEVYADGKITDVRRSYTYNDMADDGEVTGLLNIYLGEEISVNNWDVSYTFNDGDSISHYKDINVEISATSGNDVSFIAQEIKYQNFTSGYTLESLFEKELETIVNKEYIDNTADIDVGSWLVTAVGSFMDFSIFPGLSIGAMLAVVAGMGVLMMVIKWFAGG